MAVEDATNPMQGVSGPSAYSKRTDMQYSPQAYGEGVAMQQQKAGAPMATTGGVKLSQAPQVPSGGSGTTPSDAVGLYDSTQNPDQPITHGIDMGPGAGSEALAMSAPKGKLSDTLAVLLPYDTTGEITILYQNALSRGQ